ncbi:MAG TPA: homoserine O-succinyltransferase [Steroidobacteraceae bacterium]|jgi:homoserine O-acetyltransferase|nr:homoserine O-succinyltransferase [Steroidobacteraceae bacterium]
MSASLESLPVNAPSGAAPRARVRVQEGILEIPEDFPLHHGGRLREARIAWRLAGAANAPVVCALGGISADRRVCLTDDPRDGWWDETAGPDRALDTESFRILGFDYLAGRGESSGPRSDGAAADFPAISSYDQAEALRRLLDYLGIRALAAIAGASYGGMVALAFGERHPERVARLIVIGAADRAHPLATAWRSVQRQAVRFALDCGRPAEGLQLARALGMATYRSAEEFAARFDAPAVRAGRRFVFPVEEYLFARGRDYAARYSAESYLALSESIDLHRVEADRIFVPTSVIAVREDQLVPLADARALAARLPRGRVHEISSIYGHDAFLKEPEQLRAIFTSALGSAP